MQKVRALEKTRWRPSAYRGSSGRCEGLAPKRTVAGSAVYKHFSCVLRVRINTVTFTFNSLVHFAGPRGRVVQGR